MAVNKQTAFGTIRVTRVVAPEKAFELTLTFFDRQEYENTIIILDGVKEVTFKPSWGASIHTARTAVEDVKFWLLDRLA